MLHCLPLRTSLLGKRGKVVASPRHAALKSVQKGQPQIQLLLAEYSLALRHEAISRKGQHSPGNGWGAGEGKGVRMHEVCAC